MMILKIITVEEHIQFKNITEAIQKQTGNALPNLSSDMLNYMHTSLPSANQMEDTSQARIKFMNQYGIDMQVLSYGNSSPQNLQPALAVELCRQANDQMAAVVASNPTRFVGLATLPVGDPTAAVKELERAINKLGLKGVELKGNFDNRFFDDPMFFPIFEKAAELDAPIYFHPSFIPSSITDHYFNSPNWSDVATGILSSAGFGWHMDIGIQIMRMVVSGIFDKLPSLTLVSGHWGEFIPMFFERLDEELTPYSNLKHPFSYYYRHNIYLTPSGMFTKPQLDLVKTEMGADHIIYSVDYPYKQPTNTNSFLTQSGLSNDEIELISHQNAEQVFHLDEN